MLKHGTVVQFIQNHCSSMLWATVRSKWLLGHAPGPPWRSKWLLGHASEPIGSSKSLLEHASKSSGRSKWLLGHASEPIGRSKSLLEHASKSFGCSKPCSSMLGSHLGAQNDCTSLLRKHCALKSTVQHSFEATSHSKSLFEPCFEDAVRPKASKPLRTRNHCPDIGSKTLHV